MAFNRMLPMDASTLRLYFIGALALASLPAFANSLPALPEGGGLDRGINLGNFLETPQKDGQWRTVIKSRYFEIIRGAGFETIRVPISWPHHVTGQSPYTIDPAFFQGVDWVVAQAHRNHLKIILDYHNDDDLMKYPDRYMDRFLRIWKQVAEHYQDEPASVLFELLNEPGKRMNAPRWNSLIARSLAVIRTSNPSRIVIVGPNGANKIANLPGLVLPESDRNLLVTVHYYLPIEFTHQGASWIPRLAKLHGITWTADRAQEKQLTQSFDRAAQWGRVHNRPLFLGEFGTFIKVDSASRVRWTASVAREAEAHGISWSYWEFCSGFRVYDPVKEAWNEPLLRALLPRE
jgi:endoglucanase